MQLSEWSELEVEYGRKLLNSGLEGARSARETFLNGRPLTPFFRESFRRALTPAAIGACLGVLTYRCANRPRSVARTLASGVLGGLIGLGAGMIWEDRLLIASTASGALKSMGKARDDHWLETHPIDYA